MRDKTKEEELFTNKKTVYGPVKSWRFGESLGIDPIFETSTCSFNCIYCQLGEIQDITQNIKDYVPTERILKDFKDILDTKVKIDVVTYSGSGEPTLAKNLGEMVKGIRKLAPEIPQYVLTNATELDNPIVISNLKDIDKVILKVDAPNEASFQRVNRPAKGVTLERTLKGIENFKKTFKGELEVQSMFMPINKKDVEDLANVLKAINPDVVQLNTPKRPYPTEWHKENRGNHLEIFDYQVKSLKTISKEEAEEIESYLCKETGLKILSVYR